MWVFFGLQLKRYCASDKNVVENPEIGSYTPQPQWSPQNKRKKIKLVWVLPWVVWCCVMANVMGPIRWWLARAKVVRHPGNHFLRNFKQVENPGKPRAQEVKKNCPLPPMLEFCFETLFINDKLILYGYIWLPHIHLFVFCILYFVAFDSVIWLKQSKLWLHSTDPQENPKTRPTS